MPKDITLRKLTCSYIKFFCLFVSHVSVVCGWVMCRYFLL